MGALSFLNFPVKIALLVPAIVVVWSIAIGGPVTEMPFGLHPALLLIGSTIATAVDVMPWLDVLMTCVVIGIQVKMAVWIATLIFTIISWFTG